MTPTLYWLRQDLRISDNLALTKAATGPVVPLYLLDDDTPGAWRIGGAQRWWLHHSLEKLGQAFGALGAPLVLRRGPAATAIPAIAREIGAGRVVWNRCYEPFAIERDRALKTALTAQGLDVETFGGALLQEPWQVKTGQGQPFKVFTPFWRSLQRQIVNSAPLPAPTTLLAGPAVASESLAAWQLLPRSPNWAAGFGADWQPGEATAQQRLAAFLSGALKTYGADRDHPAVPGTSGLSPHLHFGEVTPRQLWWAAQATGQSVDKFLSEVAWREFAHHLLFHWPSFPIESWKESFRALAWKDDAAAFDTWTRGQTGYPLVDAGMRQLWQTGWMHNRVRMITASFLVKHLMIPWQRGAAWFWDTLLDADLANNAAGWQWVAGCGADAAPYFRIFNPVLQGERFDAEGAYVRRFVPELAALPNSFVHRPWEAPADILAAAGVVLGQTYPHPLVEHQAARRRALAALAAIKGDVA